MAQVRKRRKRKAKWGNCVCCGVWSSIFARGLKRGCYARHQRAGTIDRFAKIEAEPVDSQCTYVWRTGHLAGQRCKLDKYRDRSGRLHSVYCGTHRTRHTRGRDMEAPILERSTQCEYFSPGGVRCENEVLVDAKGHRKNRLCKQCLARRDAKKQVKPTAQAPGRKGELTVRSAPDKPVYWPSVQRVGKVYYSECGPPATRADNYESLFA